MARFFSKSEPVPPMRGQCGVTLWAGLFQIKILICKLIFKYFMCYPTYPTEYRYISKTLNSDAVICVASYLGIYNLKNVGYPINEKIPSINQ